MFISLLYTSNNDGKYFNEKKGITINMKKRKDMNINIDGNVVCYLK
jgi:hypothetical protein